MFFEKTFLVVIILVSITSCKSQKIIDARLINVGMDPVVESIWIPGKNPEEYKMAACG